MELDTVIDTNPVGGNASVTRLVHYTFELCAAHVWCVVFDSKI